MSAYNPRWDEIRRILENRQQTSVAELARLLGVSEVTIRKDLGRLEGQGILLRTHGGACLAEDTAAVVGFTEKSTQWQREKDLIARKALELVEDGQSILLDSGTTCLGLARLLKTREIQVITNSLPVAGLLAESEAVQLILLGGSYRAVTGAIIGQSALDQLRQYNLDIAFVGASGATALGGFSCQNLHEAHLKKMMLNQAARRIIVMDSHKFGANKFSAFAAYGEVQTLISDDGLDELDRQALKAAGVQVL
jgi:DeoR/GlpR family transcriptional regulator of sugar metabolism